MLFLKLGSQEQRLDEVLKLTAQTKHPEPQTTPTALTSQTNLSDRQSNSDTQLLRQIIREELVAALGDTGMLAENATPTEQPREYDEIEMQYQRELVLVQMEALKDQTEVSSSDIDRLMGDIAKLEPGNRTELLKMLNQALNKGEIRGNL